MRLRASACFDPRKGIRRKKDLQYQHMLTDSDKKTTHMSVYWRISYLGEEYSRISS